MAYLGCLLLPALRVGGGANGAEPVRLMTLDPGHFHAALFQKDMLAGVDPCAHVYAPLGPDLLAHLKRLEQFNSRPDHPTRWRLEVHTGPDFLERMLAERPGNVVVLSGRNQGKIQRIEAAVRNGLHVLADKPWILTPEELPRLEATLAAATAKGVIAFDAMTQRFEITCLLARALVQDQDLFGAPLPGSLEEPAVRMESVHYLFKEVAGIPLLRPPWFFDTAVLGEGLTDVGTHLVDQVQWTLFPDQPLDYRQDVAVLQASRWPTKLSLAQFQRVTGEKLFPSSLQPNLSEPQAAAPTLAYFANNTVQYTLRGLHVRLDVKWDFEAPPGVKDSELAVFRGSRSRVEVRQGSEESFIPEVYVAPNRPDLSGEVRAALQRRLHVLQATYPGLAFQQQPARFRLVIPDRCRTGHEAHFSLLVRQFLGYVRDPRTLPAWEKANMATKYFVTTRGVDRARRQITSPEPDSKQP